MIMVTVGIDLAKNVFAVRGVDATGKPALVRRSVPRGKLLELIAALPPCMIGMDACSGAHHWARLFAGFGHTVRLMAPKFVVPYRLSGIRLDELIAQYDRHIQTIAKPSAQVGQLMQLAGMGPTTATALMAMVGNGREFRCDRQLSAWLGLVPGQYSSGGKQRLGRITKAGDPYLRLLLILGARAVVAATKDKAAMPSSTNEWVPPLASFIRVRSIKSAAAMTVFSFAVRTCCLVQQRGKA